MRDQDFEGFGGLGFLGFIGIRGLGFRARSQSFGAYNYVVCRAERFAGSVLRVLGFQPVPSKMKARTSPPNNTDCPV